MAQPMLQQFATAASEARHRRRHGLPITRELASRVVAEGDDAMTIAGFAPTAPRTRINLHDTEIIASGE